MPYRVWMVDIHARKSLDWRDYSSLRNADKKTHIRMQQPTGWSIRFVLVEKKTGHTIKVY